MDCHDLVDLVAATVKVHKIRTSVSYLQLVDLILPCESPECCDSMGSVVGEEVVEIDGSIMEGGGQILRMSVCTPLSFPFCFSSFHKIT